MRLEVREEMIEMEEDMVVEKAREFVRQQQKLREVRELDPLNLEILDAVLDHHTRVAEMIIKKAREQFPNCRPQRRP